MKTSQTSEAVPEASPCAPKMLRVRIGSEFRRPSTVRLVLDLSAIWLQILAGMALFILLPNVWSFMIAVVLIGGGQHGLSLAAHEFAHYLVLPKNRSLNDHIARWLFAGPILQGFDLYRERHFAHHGLCSSDEDTKSMYRSTLRGWGLAWQIAKSLLCLDYVEQVYLALKREWKMPPTDRKGMSPFQWVAAAGSNAVIAFGLSQINPLYFFALWLYPLFSTAMLFSKLRSIVEHHPIDGEVPRLDNSGYFRDTAQPYFRSVRASWVERLIFSKMNFHYHAEHHRHPQVSYQYLPRLHRILIKTDPGDGQEGIPPYGRSYLAALRELWRPA